MTRPRTFAGDFVRTIRAHRAAEEARALAAPRIERHDVLARELSSALNRAPNAQHVHALADSFGVPLSQLRAAVANELARCRVREQEARDAVREATP